MGIKDAFEKVKEKAMDMWDSTKDKSFLLEANLENSVNLAKDKIKGDW